MTILTKEELLELLAKEYQILKHLHAKINPGTETFRFTEKQRTTLELLRFLAHQGSSLVNLLAAKSDEAWAQLEKRTENMALEQFPVEIEREQKEIIDIINSWSEEQMNEVVSLWGMSYTRKRWLVGTLLEQFVAYRMQLFLQIKASGRPELNTMNLWAGMDGSM